MAIITISREMGSGGIPIAQKAAQKLGYRLIDGETIEKIAPQYGLTREVLSQIDEKPPAFIAHLDRQIELGMNRIQLIVLEQALEGNVIIYGRGGQDLLKGADNVLRVRVIAPFDLRVERWAEREWIDPDLAYSLVRKSDQQRAGFIKYYHDRNWEDPLHYDLTINTAKISEETAVRQIMSGVKDENLLQLKSQSKQRLHDLIIQKKIQIARLADERIEDLTFQITVNKGHVIMEGHVYSETEKLAAIDGAKATPGVTKVTANLRVVGYRSAPMEL
ncbi:cytidylate kinase family protein [Geopsychrobacter electrodiphilus]|uniref:cytidylate kinase family protein n=1 Tax=Geopsychrobacter electrodiphilus TaxID=225196 RepID=UPI00035DB7A9|nr:cytidylate kinase family protein [Geopsychrobacter electrodiphilus]